MRWQLSFLRLLIMILIALFVLNPAPFSFGKDPRGGTIALQGEADRFGEPLPQYAWARLGTIRWRHGGRLLCVVFHPKGKTIVSTSEDQTVRIWDISNGNELRRLEGYRGCVRSIAFDPKGERLAAVAVDSPLGKIARGQLLLWEYKTGRKIWLRQSEEYLTSVAFSPDGNILATGGWRKHAYLWDARTGQELARFSFDEPPKEERNAINPNGVVAFSPDGRLLACGGRNGVGHIWNISSGKKEWGVYNTGGWPSFVRFSPDGKLFVSNSEKQLVIWEAGSKKRIGSIPVSATACRFSPDGSLLAVAGSCHGEVSNTLTFWNVSTRRKIGTARCDYSNEFADLLVIAFSPDGKRLAWAEKMNHRVHILDLESFGECMVSRGGHGVLSRLAFSPDGKTLALGSFDHSVYLWDLSSVSIRKTLTNLSGGSIAGLAFSADGRKLVTASDEICFWDPRIGKLIRSSNDETLEGGGDVLFSSDGHLMISQDGGEVVYVRDAESGRVLQRLVTTDFITALALSPDGNFLAAGTDDRIIIVWDLNTHKEVRRLSGNRGQRQAIAFSPDGRTLAVGGESKTIRIWELASGKICLLLPSADDVHCLAFSPDGRMLISSGKDKVVSLWELATGKRLALLNGHQGAVSDLAFSPDGKSLATASEDTTALLWHWRKAISQPDNYLLSLSYKALQRQWKNLASQDACVAYRAMWSLVSTPEQACSLIREHINPSVAPDATCVDRLITDLNSDSFSVRNRAMRELESFGEVVEPYLRKAMADNAPAETRRLAKDLFNRLSKPLNDPEKLRCLRALMILEQSNTSEGIRILKSLADGLPEARLTREAQASLKRLKKRNAIH